MHNRDSVIGAVLLGGLLITCGPVAADMEPMSEKEMGAVTGQAMLGLDVNQTDQTGEPDFTRYTVGSRSELQMNMQEMALGETSTGADVQVNNLSLGHIARADGTQFDGNTYSANDIVPFVGVDPYLELAENNGDVVGFRMGFTEARGTLSGKFGTLSGQLGIELEDSSGNVQQGQLLNANGGATSKRAGYFGVAGSDCSTQCAPLSAIQTLEVGERNPNAEGAAFTNDFFISFQNQALDWETPGDATGTVSTDSGVFINIPTAMRLEMGSLQDNTVVPRKRTEYIDRGKGLF